MKRYQFTQSLALLLALASSALAQEAPQPAPEAEVVAPAADTADLAKAAQNPLSSMISLPFQYNLFEGVERYDIDKDAILTRGLLRRLVSEDQGPDGVLRLRLRSRLFRSAVDTHDRTQHLLNIQPVIPVPLGEVNLINRLIIPLLYQPTGESGGEFGLGDIQYMAFFSPADAGKIIWGVGPIFSLPTATDDILGTGKWSIGPTAVALTIKGRWVYGVLANNLWSFAGEGDRPDVNSMLLNPFINYNLDKGWYLTSSPNILANWEADSDDRWTVPVGGGVGKIFKIGKQPMSASLTAYYNVEKPDGAADWNAQFQFKFMFPTGKKH